MQQMNFKVSFLGSEYNAWYVTEVETALQILSELQVKDCIFGIDTETYAVGGFSNYPDAALSPHLSKIRLLQVCDGKNVIVFDLPVINAIEIFIPFLESKKFIAHYAIFDLQYFLKMGVKQMSLGCTRILAKHLFHAVYPTDAGADGSLASLAKQFLKVELSKASQKSDWSDDLTFEQIEYAALDAICVLKLAEKLAPGLTKYGLERIYKLSKEAQLPLAKMQMNGLAIDVEAHKKLIDKWRVDVAAARTDVTKLTGIQDVTNPKIAAFLEKSLPAETLAEWPRTPGGKLSTDAHAFSDFSYLDIVKPMAAFQKAATMSSTFGQGLLNRINPYSKRIHTRYNIAGARTGRLSSSDPNFQNAPRTDEFRALFIAEPGKLLMTADYSQIELRVAAELSQDQNMLNVYRAGEDIYKVTAARLNQKKLEDVTKPERQVAKALALGLLFGLGKEKFAHYARKGYQVELSDAQAEDSITKFRELYSGYREWQLDQAACAKESLIVYTPCGKRRRLPEDETFGNSMNHPIQGGAAEILLYALVDLEKKSRQYGFKLLNTVHDEVVLEVDRGAQTDVSEVVTKTMTEAYLKVFPNGVVNKLVSVGCGTNWAEAK